jgi:hypothetical protein
VALAAPVSASAADPRGFVPVAPATFGPAPAVAEFPVNRVPPVPEFDERRQPTTPDIRVPGRVMVLQKQAGDTDPVVPPLPPPADAADKLDPKESRSVYEQRYGKLPGKLEVFRLESEAELERRILHELHRDDTPEELAANRFPPPPILVPPGTTYVPKTAAYPPVKTLIEPGYVVHRRLYFEEKNSERFGWDLGFAQPMVSALTFYKDALLWPAKIGSNPHERYDTSAGKCLPGSPVPYYLYPPEIDLWGATFAAGVYTGTAFLFP